MLRAEKAAMNRTQGGEGVAYSTKNGTDTQKALENSINDDIISNDNRAQLNSASSINWVYKSELFSTKENILFHQKISEINQGSQAFAQNSRGEYMLPINNKIVFTSGDYDSPYVSRVIEVMADSMTEFEAIRKLVYEVETGKSGKQAAVRVIELSFGQWCVYQYDSSNNNPIRWTNGRRERSNRRKIVERYQRERDARRNAESGTSSQSVSYSARNIDSDYLNAVNSGDMATAQSLVDKAAKEAGYTDKVYHATNAEFTVFDVNKTSNNNFHGKGIYFTNSQRDVENNYENYQGPDPWAKIDDRAMELAEEKYGISYEETLTSDPDIIDKVNECYNIAISEFESTIRRVTAYIKVDNPYVFEKGDNINADVDRNKHGLIVDKQVYENIGHSGMDENTIHYVVFNPALIKSADPVTYDDNGNIIPLSERFNLNNPDIRYSAKKSDTVQRITENFGYSDATANSIYKAARTLRQNTASKADTDELAYTIATTLENRRNGNTDPSDAERIAMMIAEDAKALNEDFIAENKPIIDRLNGTKISISEADISDLGDAFSYVKGNLFPYVMLTKGEGISVDSLFQDLADTHSDVYEDTLPSAGFVQGHDIFHFLWDFSFMFTILSHFVTAPFKRSF